MDGPFWGPVRPFDHPVTGPPSSNPLQRFIDSELGVVLSNIAHTAGALLFMAGIALYLYQAHLLRRAKAEGAAANLGLLDYAHVSTVIGVGLNGFGGLARMYQSGHPSLTQIADSPWVQVLFVKHLFLILGILLAFWVTWRTWSYARRPDAQPRLERAVPRVVTFSIASVVTIMLATVLGAMAAVAPLTRDGDGTLLATGENHEMGDLLQPPGVDRLSVPGLVQAATPLRPEVAQYGFRVNPGKDRLVAELNWTTPNFRLDLVVRDPTGKVPAAQTTRGTAIVSSTIAGAAVVAGLWTLEVRSDQAVNERFTLSATASPGGETYQEFDRVVTIPGGREFFEANLEMVGPRTLNYSWEVVGDHERTVFFDIHVHDPETGRTVEPVAGSWNRLAGTYRHASEGPAEASLLWQNDGADPVTVHVRFWGHFAIDSIVPED